MIRDQQVEMLQALAQEASHELDVPQVRLSLSLLSVRVVGFRCLILGLCSSTARQSPPSPPLPTLFHNLSIIRSLVQCLSTTRSMSKSTTTITTKYSTRPSCLPLWPPLCRCHTTTNTNPNTSLNLNAIT